MARTIIIAASAALALVACSGNTGKGNAEGAAAGKAAANLSAAQETATPAHATNV
jgi:hypothetical protein